MKRAVGSSAILEQSRSAKSGRYLTCVSGLNGIARYVQAQRRFGHLPHTLIIVCLLLASCGNPTVQTPVPQNSPQTTVALTNKSVADADLAAVKTVIALRDAGKLSQANTDSIENWLAIVAHADRSIGLILAKPESWDAQKKEIFTLLATVTAPTVAGTIDPGAQAIITQVMTLVNQLKVMVAP